MNTYFRLALVAAVAGLVVGCAGYSRVSEYPAHAPSNIEEVEFDGQRFLIKRHPTEPTILIQVTMFASAGASLASEFTGANVTTAATRYPRVVGAAETWAEDNGCSIDDFYQLASVSWEAVVACPKASDAPGELATPRAPCGGKDKHRCGGETRAA